MSSTTTRVASFGPWFLTVIRYVTTPPTIAVGGDAVFLTERSVQVALGSSGFGPGVGLGVGSGGSGSGGSGPGSGGGVGVNRSVYTHRALGWAGVRLTTVAPCPNPSSWLLQTIETSCQAPAGVLAGVSSITR